MIVTGIERQKKQQGRYSIFVDGEFAVGVGSEVLLAAGLRKGDEITAGALDQLRNNEELRAARRSAARYLGGRRRTEWEVRQRLSAKEFPDPLIDRVVSELRSSGVIDDRAFIQAFVHDAELRKPSGPRMLAVKLRRKGLDRAVIEEVLPEVLPAEEERSLALKSAEAYVSRLRRKVGSGSVTPPAKARYMLRRYLAGRGFDSGAIATALKRVLPMTEEPG